MKIAAHKSFHNFDFLSIIGTYIVCHENSVAYLILYLPIILIPITKNQRLKKRQSREIVEQKIFYRLRGSKQHIPKHFSFTTPCISADVLLSSSVLN